MTRTENLEKTYTFVHEGRPFPQMPMPTDRLGNWTVVASTIYREADSGIEDEESDKDIYLVLVLAHEPPFFEVAHIARVYDSTWKVLWSERHMNIVPAVEAYQEAGGDY